MDSRHAPEHRFPAAADDALAAVHWVGGHARDLGGIAGHTSGDIFVAFSTANLEADRVDGVATVAMLPNNAMNPLFEATIEATEEAIVNALVAATPMVGNNGSSVPALPHERVRDILRQYGRLTE